MYDAMPLLLFIDEIFTIYQFVVFSELMVVLLLSVPLLACSVLVSSGMVVVSPKSFNVEQFLWFLLACIIGSALLAGLIVILGETVLIPQLMSMLWVN